ETRRGDGAVGPVAARVFVLANGVFETPRLLLTSPRSEGPGGLGIDHDLVGRYLHAHPRLRISIPRQDDRLGLEGVWRSHAFRDALPRHRMGSRCADLH